MSRFNYIYEPLTIIKLNHKDDLVTEQHVTLYPSKETAALIAKHRLVIKEIPEGLVVLYKKEELFVAETVDNILIIDEKEVIDQKIVGYVSTSPDRTFSNWLPEVVDVDLEFYAITDQTYKKDTKLETALSLNQFINYNNVELEGILNTNNNINERVKPDAILQINIAEANITTPITLTFEIK